MGKKLARQLWNDLLNWFDALDRPVDVQKLVAIVMVWTSDHLGQFGQLAARYGLDELVRFDPEQQPIEYSDIDADEEIERFRAVSPASLETLTVRLRDLLWSALVYRTHRQCPRCDSDRLRALRTETSSTVLACDFCGFACDAHGNAWEGKEKLLPMTVTELKNQRLLLRPAK